MRPATKVDEVALAIQGQVFVRRNALDDLGLVDLANATKKLGRLVALPDFSFDAFVAVHDVLHAGLDRFEVGVGKRLFACKVVIETVLDGRTDRYLGVRPQFLDGFGENMCSVVPQQLDAVIRIASNDFHGSVCLDIPGQIPELAIDANRHSGTSQSFANAGGNFTAPGGSVKLLNGAVR